MLGKKFLECAKRLFVWSFKKGIILFFGFSAKLSNKHLQYLSELAILSFLFEFPSLLMIMRSNFVRSKFNFFRRSNFWSWGRNSICSWGEICSLIFDSFDHEVEFCEIEIQLFQEVKFLIMRSKFNLFMRWNLFINIWQFWSWGRISWDQNSTFSGGRIFDHEVKIQFVHEVEFVHKYLTVLIRRSTLRSWDQN